MRGLFLLLAWLSVTGCQAGYYMHLAKGQWDLSRRAKPFSWWEAHSTDAALHARLQDTRDTLAFARDELGFDTGRLYRRYVEVDRPYVVWSLTATMPFSFEPRQWCYPLIGCAPYRGFFDFARLQAEKARLEASGYEVYVFGAQAYSTLGWFNDPVTSLMLSDDRWDNAELLLHELTHAHYYRPGDTTFNESLATAVARLAVGLWIARLDPELRDARQQSWQAQDRALQEVVRLVSEARSALEALYSEEAEGSEATEGQAASGAEGVATVSRHQREQQLVIREQLRQRFHEAKARLPALAAYDGWFAQPLTNAQLNLMHFYQGQVSVFIDIYDSVGGDWQAFWNAVMDMPASEVEK